MTLNNYKDRQENTLLKLTNKISIAPKIYIDAAKVVAK